MVLGLRRQGPGSNGRNHLAQHAGTHGRHPVEQLAAGLLRADGDLLATQHVAGHAGLGITVQHRPLHRSTAAVLRQQRDVQVDATVLRQFQHRLGQDAAVSHHHDQFRGKGTDVGILAAVP